MCVCVCLFVCAPLINQSIHLSIHLSMEQGAPKTRAAKFRWSLNLEKEDNSS